MVYQKSIIRLTIQDHYTINFAVMMSISTVKWNEKHIYTIHQYFEYRSRIIPIESPNLQTIKCRKPAQTNSHCSIAA